MSTMIWLLKLNTVNTADIARVAKFIEKRVFFLYNIMATFVVNKAYESSSKIAGMMIVRGLEDAR